MAQSNGTAPMIRPESLDKLPSLDDSKKALYRAGLTRLWAAYEGAPEGSTARNEMEGKIRQASAKIMADISKSTRPGSGTGVQQPQHQQGRPNGMAGQNPAQTRPMQQQQAPQQAQQQGQQQAGQQQNAQQAAVNAQIVPKVRNVVEQIAVHVPANIAPGNHDNYKNKWQQEAMKTLMAKERVMAQGRGVQTRINALQQSGQEVPAQSREQLEMCRRQVKEIEIKWNTMLQSNENIGKQRGVTVQGQSAPQAAQQQPNASVQNQHNQTAARPGQDAKQDQSGAGSPVQASGFPQQTGQMPQQAARPVQGYPPQGQNMSMERPAQNVQMPQGAAPQQQAAAPALNPQVQNNQRPQPLSQQAAMAQAREQHDRAPNQAQTNVNAPQQAIQPQVANAMAFPPQSASQNTPTSAYPPQNSMQGPNNKFPISKQLTLDPRTQQPVAGPPSRPTLANQGMTSQPGLTRPAPFTLEGEGDRVLSKRKLDELVRQVTGSSDTSPEAGGLTPDVEDAVLSLADDFVDNVITSACRLAKLRSGQTLDIKDVQMVLERNYGIRIPGYSLDEVRTVRKFQPAPGWQSKMQAIQTAKTLGGVKGDS